MDWKKQFDRTFDVTDRGNNPKSFPCEGGYCEMSPEEMKTFFSEIIEKLIADIEEQVTTHTEHDGSYCDTGEDMDWYCRSKCTEMAIKRIQSLKQSWL